LGVRLELWGAVERVVVWQCRETDRIYHQVYL